MNYILLYILLGSLGLNLLYMYQYEKTSKTGLILGFTSGIILGPLSILVFVYYLIKHPQYKIK